MAVETKKISKVLVANRGEIAVRVIRAARDAGISSVAVYAEPDAQAPFVTLADEAFALGGSTSADSYLVFDKILDAAAKSGADAIHPGYGFLSENADFAQAVIDAGLTWIGPPPQSIRALGDKVTARHIAERAEAPMAPGTTEPVATAEEIERFADDEGLPIAIKAAFGGGGRGLLLPQCLHFLEPENHQAAHERAGDHAVRVQEAQGGHHVFAAHAELVAHVQGAVGAAFQVVAHLLGVAGQGRGGHVGQTGIGQAVHGAGAGAGQAAHAALVQQAGQSGAQVRQDAAGQRDVTGLQLHAGGARVGAHDRQQRRGGQHGRLVRERVDDLRHADDLSFWPHSRRGPRRQGTGDSPPIYPAPRTRHTVCGSASAPPAVAGALAGPGGVARVPGGRRVGGGAPRRRRRGS